MGASFITPTQTGFDPSTEGTAEIPQQPQAPFNTSIVGEEPAPWHPYVPRDALITSIIGSESSGRPNVTGKAGEIGLMQIMPSTARHLGFDPAQLKDPAINRAAGTKYMSELLHRYNGNEFMALVAYNSGPGRVDRGVFLPKSVKYATDILNRAGKPAMPSFMSQANLSPRATAPQPQPQATPPPPSILGRMGSAIGGALEGTAEAAEGPPGMPPSTSPPSETAMARPDAPAPMTPPALPKGFQPKGATSAAAPVQPTMPKGFVPKFKMSMSVGPTGPRFGMTEITPKAATAAEKQALDQNLAVMNQLDRAQKAYDDVAKHPEYFTAKEQNLDYLKYFHSRIAKNISAVTGGTPTPPAQVQALLDSVGQLQAMLAKGYMGGRMGAKMLAMLAPHMPQPGDSLEAIGMRMKDLKPTLASAFEIMKLAETDPDAAEQMLNHVAPEAGSSDTAKPPTDLPKGATIMKGKLTKDGKPVYRLPDGRYWTP